MKKNKKKKSSSFTETLLYICGYLFALITIFLFFVSFTEKSNAFISYYFAAAALFCLTVTLLMFAFGKIISVLLEIKDNSEEIKNNSDTTFDL